MKKLIILFVLFLGLGIANAQDKKPTFDETVNYIIQNTKGKVMYPGELDAYSRVEGYHLKDVKIEKNGKIELIANQEKISNGYNNNFSITFNIFDLVEKVDYPDGIRAHKFLVHFNGLNVSSGYGITYATDADAQKVARAFRHLKTLCVKENDLFSQIPEEEKKTKLSKGETINYINQALSKLGSVLYYGDKMTWDKTGYWKNEEMERKYTNIFLFCNNSSKTYEIDFKDNLYFEGYDKAGHISRYFKFYYNRNYKSIILKNAKVNYVSKHLTNNGASILTVYNGIEIILSEKCLYTGAIQGESNPYEERNKIFLPLPEGDTTNINRIKKAFERLIELESDEKDPFDD